MNVIFIFLLVITSFLVSCKSAPKEQAVQPPPARPTRPAPPPAQQTQNTAPKTNTRPPVFDPSSITQAQKDTAMLEIQALTQRLNTIIRAKNYNGWVPYLDPEYLATINSPEFLDAISKSPVLVKEKIVLHSSYDYFMHVVVPSRANSRVDDIEFISQRRVKAYTIDSRGNRLRLYDLEKTGSEWKIIN